MEKKATERQFEQKHKASRRQEEELDLAIPEV